MAPEVLLANQNIITEIDEKVDVYSFGILLWEITTKETPYLPYKSFSFENFSKNVVLRGERPIQSKNCPNELFKLMSACWETYPEGK